MPPWSLPVRSRAAASLPDASGRPNPALGGGARDERHHLACHLERLVDVFVGVRSRDQEQALLWRLDDHAAFQKLCIERREGALCRDSERFTVITRRLSREPELKERANAGPAGLQAGNLGGFDEPQREPLAACVQLFVEPRRAGFAARSEYGGA